MRLTAPSAVNIPEGKYGIARKISITLNPFLPLNSSAFFRYLDLAINFSAEERKIVRIKIKDIITPAVSASHDKIIPGTIPKSKPFAVDTNIDGKNPKAFINTSNKKLNTIAHIPNEAI